MRLFIAVPVSDELKEKILGIQNRIKLTGIDAKLVEAENLHFTIKFLGETPEEKIQEIKNAIEKACANFSPFDIGIAGIGAFPNRNYARVVWVSAREGLQDFENLIKAVDENVSKLSFQKENGYAPHLTIARIRSGRNAPKLQKMLEELEKPAIGKMRVEEVKLMKSTLTKNGPIYEEVCSVKLKIRIKD